MVGYDKHVYASMLIKGDLHAAIAYVEAFPDQAELYDTYKDIFIDNHDMQRSTNAIINEIDKCYQSYYKDVFWFNKDKEVAEQILFEKLWVICGERSDVAKDYQVEQAIEKMVVNEGYSFLGGSTAGFYGPYIWKTNLHETYEVDLPSGVQRYSLTMMDGFVSRSWLDYISFGRVGTGGWSGKDGNLCCVRALYDTDSQAFKVSFLKHEAQHSYDQTLFPHITSPELEYRAKLVELIYWDDEEKIKGFILEADMKDEHNTHAVASYRIISDLSKLLLKADIEKDPCMFEGMLCDVQNAAKELLDKDTARLNESFNRHINSGVHI